MKKNVWYDTLKQNKRLFLLFLVTIAVNASVFLLYRILTEALVYAGLISFIFFTFLLIGDFIHRMKKAEQLEAAKASARNGETALPVPEGYEEAEYQEIIEGLTRKINALVIAFDEEKKDMQDWYLMWVHQIKTPIAVMKLKESDKDISNELFRIEEYADMALSYIRLGSRQNDLVIREYPLDELIRGTLRKYAAQFIAKKVKLIYTPTDQTVITDKKWLTCIIEQYISNAIKYTHAGTVAVSFDGETLTVSDTGIGIAAEDLPRIFEKGYTGANGRTNVKASGLGLYLCTKAAALINVRLTADSTVGQGSRFSIVFPKEREGSDAFPDLEMIMQPDDL